MHFEDSKDPELQERLKNCKTTDELVKLAKEEGMELSDEQLDSVAGGAWGHPCNDDTCHVPFGR